MLPLAFVLASFLQGGAFVPALQHGTKSVPQWIEELAHGSRPLDALWSLYYADDHSPQVLAALKDTLASAHPTDCRLVADSILCQWHVPHDLLPADVYSHGFTFTEYLKGFAPPIPPMEGSTSELEMALHSPNEQLRVSAALALLQQHQRVQLAVRELLEQSLASDWACAHAGSAWFEVLGERLGEVGAVAGLSKRHQDWRWQLESQVIGRSAALPRLETLAQTSAEAAETLKPLIRRILDGSVEEPGATAHWLLHMQAAQPIEDVDPFLEAHYVELAQKILQRPDSPLQELLGMHSAALRYPGVAELCLRVLPEWLERKDETGLESLGILGHLGSTDPRTRAAYLRTLREWTALDKESLDRLPCWKKHDAETRAAFLALLKRVPEPGRLFEQLCFAGEVDAATSDLAREFLERTDGIYAWAVSRGFKGRVEVDARLPLASQVHQIALNIATKQARGQEHADDEQQLVAILERPYTKDGAGGYDDQVQWGLFHAQELGLRSRAMVHVALHYLEIGDTMEGFSTHSDAAEPYLESIPLDVEDHLALRKLRPPDRPESGWRGVNIVNNRFGGEPVSKVSLEDVPRWRRKVFSGEPRSREAAARDAAHGARGALPLGAARTGFGRATTLGTRLGRGVHARLADDSSLRGSSRAVGPGRDGPSNGGACSSGHHRAALNRAARAIVCAPLPRPHRGPPR